MLTHDLGSKNGDHPFGVSGGCVFVVLEAVAPAAAP